LNRHRQLLRGVHRNDGPAGTATRERRRDDGGKETEGMPLHRPVEPSPYGRRTVRSPVPQQRTNLPIGRIEVVNHAHDLLATGQSVLLRGPAGIGKSTILETLAHGRRDALILRVAAAEVESGLPYLTLVDLFGTVLADHGIVLRGHLRAALDAALLRSAAPATAQDELAVRLAVLELLRALAARSPVLLVIDDLPWVDEPSAGVLQFVARRLDGLPVQMIAAARVNSDEMIMRADLCPPPCSELTVPPLGADDVADLLRARYGERLNRSAILRVHAASGGNPLFALELGRGVAERGEPITLDEPLPVPDRLRGLLAARVAALPQTTRDVLVVAAAAARPTRDLLERAGALGPGILMTAIDSGVSTVATDGAIRFTHPLLREMVYADATMAARSSAHERLATAVEDPVERARHLALARPEPDETLAEVLADAATVARRRGAPAVAADLAQLAAERSLDPAAGARRRLSAARFAEEAGMTENARNLALDALRTAVDPSVRVDLRILLIDLAGQDQSHNGPLLDEAYADAGTDAALGSRVRYYRGLKALYDGDLSTAESELSWARHLAEASGETEMLIASLSILATSGLDIDNEDELFRTAATLARSLPLTSTVLAVRLLDTAQMARTGDLAGALADLETMRTAVERGGSVTDLGSLLFSLSAAYVRAGRFADALAAGRLSARIYADLDATPGPGLLAGGIGELYGGTLDAAARGLEQAVSACIVAGDGDFLQLAYAAHGQTLMLQGDLVGALDPYRLAYDLQIQRRLLDPGLYIWHADFVETLIGAGARAEAARVLAEATIRADELSREWALLSLARANGMLVAADGDPRAGAAEVTAAIERWAKHPFPMEIARAWHSLGTIERRAHRRGAAREAFGEAARRYALLGAQPWLEVVEAELAKLNGPRGMGMSETEQRIVDLVRRGCTNREIARATFLSVKAIEANLTRLYRRFGVRNRDQLSRAVAEISLD
jgi:DNA-binding CsgD family transcriptional regulator